MIFRGPSVRCLLAALLLAGAGGCSLSDSGQTDEENEPHFLLGKSRVNAVDYSAAADAFRESLQVNPHSAAAHFQLACLFEPEAAKLPDPAAAIYHFQEFLKLKPHSEKAASVRDRIEACKVRLAQDVTAMPSMPAAQKQLEQLTATNRLLLAEVNQWRTFYAKQQAEPKPEIPPAQNNVTPPPEKNVSHPPRAAAPPPKTPPVKFKTHIVAKYETLAVIARKYHVSLPALQAVNPGVNSSKLRVGQPINLPP